MDINLTNPVTTAKIGEVVNGASAATPNDTDLLPVIESSVTKKLTLTNLKAFLKTYFDTLYSNLGYTAENVANKSSSYTLSSTTTYANTKALVDGLATKEPLKGSDDNYVTDAQLVVIGNTSGTNSGDSATNSTSNTYADNKITQVITNGVTNKAPSEDAVFDALALKANLSEPPFCLKIYSGIITPADSTIYYVPFVPGFTLATTTPGRNVMFKTALTLKRLSIYAYQGTNGSSEDMILYLRNLTTSTDYLIGNITNDSGNTNGKYFDFTGLSIAVNVTDTYALKFLSPAYTTNPVGTIYDGQLYF